MAEPIEELLVKLSLDVEDMQRKVNAAMSSAERAAQKGGAGIERHIQSAVRVSTVALMALGTAATAALGGVAFMGIKLAAEMEASRTAFTQFLGSVDKANNLLQKLRDFAAKTPFEFIGLQNAARTFIAFGFEANQIIPVMTAVGNAVAAVGGGQEKINQVTRALTQMLSTGRLSAEEMNQLANAGIMAWPMLAEKMGKSIGEVRKMAEQGLISGADAAQMLLEGFAAKNAGMMEAQSKTINGIFSNLKDATDSMMTVLGEKIVETFDLKTKLAGFVEAMTDFATLIRQEGLQGALAKIFPENTRLVIVGIVGAIGGLLVPALVALSIAILGATWPLIPFMAAGALLLLLAFKLMTDWKPVGDFFGTIIGFIFRKAFDFVMFFVHGTGAAFDKLGRTIRLLQAAILQMVAAFSSGLSHLMSLIPGLKGAADQVRNFADKTQAAAKAAFLLGEEGFGAVEEGAKKTSKSLKDLVQEGKSLSQLFDELRAKDEGNEEVGVTIKVPGADVSGLGLGGGKAAKEAKTAIQELGISVDALRQAMTLLNMTADEQKGILMSLGVEADEAGIIIEGLGVTVDKLAMAFQRAGFSVADSYAKAGQVSDLIAAKKAEEEAAEAAAEAARKFEEHEEKAASLADTIRNSLIVSIVGLVKIASGGLAVSKDQLGSFLTTLGLQFELMEMQLDSFMGAEGRSVAEAGFNALISLFNKLNVIANITAKDGLANAKESLDAVKASLNAMGAGAAVGGPGLPGLVASATANIEQMLQNVGAAILNLSVEDQAVVNEVLNTINTLLAQARQASIDGNSQAVLALTEMIANVLPILQGFADESVQIEEKASEARKKIVEEEANYRLELNRKLSEQWLAEYRLRNDQHNKLITDRAKVEIDSANAIERNREKNEAIRKASFDERVNNLVKQADKLVEMITKGIFDFAGGGFIKVPLNQAINAATRLGQTVWRADKYGKKKGLGRVNLDLLRKASGLEGLPSFILQAISQGFSGEIPQFAAGGMVAGAFNQPVPAIVHGGERVLSIRENADIIQLLKTIASKNNVIVMDGKVVSQIVSNRLNERGINMNRISGGP